MANENQILVSAAFDEAELKKQVDLFGKTFRKSLNAALKDLKIDLSGLGKAKDISLAVKLDLKDAKQQIQEFRDGLKPIPIEVKAVGTSTKQTLDPNTFTTSQRILDRARQDMQKLVTMFPQASDETKKFVSELQKIQNKFDGINRERQALIKSLPAGAIIPPISDTAIKQYNKVDLLLNKLYEDYRKFQTAQASAPSTLTPFERLTQEAARLRTVLASDTVALDTLKKALDKGDLSLLEIERKTAKYANSLNTLKIKIDQVDTELRKTSPDLDKVDKSLRTLANDADLAGRKIASVDPAHMIETAKAQKVDSFFKNFAFSIGLIGYGLQNMGRQLQGAAQGMFNLAQQSAELSEPLERIRNLLAQDPNLTDETRSFIEGQLRRLADLPGSDLAATAKSFRNLKTLGLELVDTLSLIEGLTKATALSGVGAEGITAISAQLREFKASGQLKKSDVKNIIEQGGQPVSDILKKSFGSLDAEALVAAGPDAVIKALIDGLAKLEPPLATTSDRLNRIKNSLILIGAEMNKVLAPGLDALASLLKNTIEPALAKLVETFNNLPQGFKTFISYALVSLPIVLVGLGALLTALGALAIATAVVFKVSQGWTLVMARLGFATVVGAKSTSLFTQILAKLSSILAPLLARITVFRAGIVSIGTALTVVIRAMSSVRFGLSTMAAGAFAQKSLFFGLAAIQTSLGGIFTGLLRILGLTTPLGLIVNTILAIATNAGHARDVVVGAIGKVIESFGKLNASLSTLFGADFGTGLLKVLDTLVNILGGTLGNILASILSQVSSIINAFSEFINLLNGESSWQKVGDAFVNALTGGVTVLGKLMAASFLETVGEIAPSVRNKDGSWNWTAGLAGGAGGILLAEKFGGGNFKEAGANIRESVFPGTKENKLAEETEKAKNQVNAMNRALLESNKLTSSLEKSVNGISIAFAKISADLKINQLKFQLQMASDSAKDEFEQLIKRDPNAAQAQLGGFLSKEVNNAKIAIRAEASTQIKTVSEEVQRAFGDLNALPISKLIEIGGPGTSERHFAFIDALRQIQNLAKSGKTDLASYSKAINAVDKSGQALADQFRGKNVPDNLKDSLLDYTKAVDDTKTSIGGLTTVLGQRANEEQKIAQERVKTQENYNRLIDDQLKKEQATIRAGKLKLELEALNEIVKTQENLLNNAQSINDIAQIDQINTNILNTKQLIADKEKEISDAQQFEIDSAKVLEASAERTLKKAQIQNEQLRTRRQMFADMAKASAELFKTSVDGMDEFLTKIKELRTLSSSVDLFSGSALEDLLKSLESDRDRLEQVRQYVASNRIVKMEAEDDKVLANLRAGFGASPVQLDTDITTLRLLTESIKTTTDGFDKGADKFAKAAVDIVLYIAKKQTEINIALINAQDDVDSAMAKLADPSLTEQERVATQKALDVAVATKKALGDQGQYLQIQQNELNAATVEWNKILQNTLEVRQRITNQQIKQLQATKILLELEQRLIDAKAQNASKRNADVLFGSDNQAKKDLPVKSQEDLNKAYEKQIELIKNKYALERAGLEQTRIQLELDLEKSGADREAIGKTIALLDKQLAILKEIEGEEVKGIQNAKAQSEKGFFGSAVSVLTDALAQYSNSAREAREATRSLLDQFASGEFILDSFQKMLDGTVNGLATLAVIGATAVATLEQAFTTALRKALMEGENFLQSFSKALGDALINMGLSLIATATAAVAMGAVWGIFTGDWSRLMKAVAMLPVALASGAALIALGGVLGGGGAAQSTNTNTANNASVKTGATGDDVYDPNRDPKLVAQKALMAQILIDIRTDSGQIVKTIIKTVNNNARVGNLIGNRKVEFGY